MEPTKRVAVILENICNQQVSDSDTPGMTRHYPNKQKWNTWARLNLPMSGSGTMGNRKPEKLAAVDQSKPPK